VVKEESGSGAKLISTYVDGAKFGFGVIQTFYASALDDTWFMVRWTVKWKRKNLGKKTENLASSISPITDKRQARN